MSRPPDDPALHAAPDALAPLRRPVFRALWIALFVSSIGTWMHDVGAGWLMTTLAPDPFMVALVQAAMLLPAFLLALPAGAMADMVDRRVYLIVVMCWLIVAAGGLAALTWLELTDARLLLAFTFAMGMGTAMMIPAFSAIIPDLVPRGELTAALTLNSIVMNTSRALGPALAGVLVAAAGPAVVFAFNSVSYVAILLVLIRWRNTQPRSTLPSERLLGAMRTGLRFGAQSPALKTVLIKCFAFFVMACTLWAFLPLIVREQLGAGPETFGLLLGCAGAGAVIGGLNLATLRRRFSGDAILGGATVVMVAALLGLAHLRAVAPVALALLLAGAAWIAAVSTLQVSAQMSLPHWVRARGLALFLTVFMGTMAAGSAAWGRLASVTDIPLALSAACAVGLAGWLLTASSRLATHADADRSPSEPVPDPALDSPVAFDRGPVMVNVEYLIDPTDATGFQHAMRDVRRLRLRNGAVSWNLFQDVTDHRRWVETFVDETWLSHLRQHHRLTVEDRAIAEAANAFHRGEAPPRIEHMVARNPSKRARRWQRW